MERLEDDKKLAIELFENNYMKLNEDKCHFFVARNEYETLWVNIGESRIWESKNEKLLELNILRITCLLCAINLLENCQLCLEFQVTRVFKKRGLFLFCRHNSALLNIVSSISRNGSVNLYVTLPIFFDSPCLIFGDDQGPNIIVSIKTTYGV